METMRGFVVENEALKRQLLKMQLGQQRQRLGEMMVSREGTKFNEVWVDGHEMSGVRRRLREVEKEAEAWREEQKKKKSVGKGDDAVGVQVKLNLLGREEEALKRQLEVLEAEKKQYLRDMKRVNEEEQ